MRAILETLRRTAHVTLIGCLSAMMVLASAGHASAADMKPMKQGVHEWPIMGGKLILVVGTYQDSVHFRHSYSFYFKERADDTWHQVAVTRKRGLSEFPWESAVGGEVTLADGIVVARREGVYFVVGEKRVKNSYYDKGDITATWNKLSEAGDDDVDGPRYRMVTVFTRAYPDSSLTVETVLERETKLRPAKR